MLGLAMDRTTIFYSNNLLKTFEMFLQIIRNCYRISLFTFATLSLVIVGCGSSIDIESSAKPIVEQIFKEHQDLAVRYPKIEKIRETGEDKYTGKAYITIDGDTGIVDVEI
jgi:hypothetical protein